MYITITLIIMITLYVCIKFTSTVKCSSLCCSLCAIQCLDSRLHSLSYLHYNSNFSSTFLYQRQHLYSKSIYFITINNAKNFIITIMIILSQHNYIFFDYCTYTKQDLYSKPQHYKISVNSSHKND